MAAQFDAITPTTTHEWPNAFVPVAYDTDNASLCEQWERFLVENSPHGGKVAQAHVKAVWWR